MHDPIFGEETFREQAIKDGVTHVSTGVAVVKDGKILVVRRASNDFLGGNYELPGGGVDEGETITEGAVREVKEEAGLTVSSILTAFAGFDYSTDQKPHVRQVNFIVETEPGEVMLDPGEHDAYLWVNETNLTSIRISDNMKTCVMEALSLIKQLA